MDLARASLAEVVAGLEKQDFGSRDVVDACLEVAKKNAGRTHAYVQLFEHEARRAADEADARRRYSLKKSPLDGVPVAIKDNMLLVGSRTTAASAIIANSESPYDATVVRRLREAGAIFLGKTNLDEFAMGSSTETSCHGPTKNPWDLAKIPGGSSGGSAVAVAEGSATVALGSDTGGSIRQPAAMCGVVGLKPTYGRVSRYGLMAMASSLDQIGPITKTVEDAAIMLGVIEGRDPMDSTSVELQRGWSLPAEWPESLKGLRVGLPKEYFVSGMDPEVETAVRGAVATLERLGATVKEVSLPHAEHALAVYYVLMPSEVSANLARFDGIRYGVRKAGESLEETYRKSRGEGFGKEVRRRIMLGTYALSSGYYDAYYLKALKVRRLIANDFSQAFQDVDCIVTPTSPVVAWGIGEKTDDPLSMYLADIYTVSVNVAGLPAISVPCGLAKGLPVGLQLIGRHFDEKTILTAAKAYETAAGLRASMRPPSA
ncbi:MAG TPA: Asp-tRNA(Asn)/Glu-tRNA(Gln) amidotransferase subunit GatA [Patescibacteria group bacterium]|nr:Asp-tRNA(Asn)/Glu-tRNA(Gln) amidotransferase subunit GatA [Patescibacteria group bacterium]